MIPNWMNAIPLAAVVVGGLAVGAAAQTPVRVASAAPEEELAALLAVLEEETAVATKAKMNSDFVPGLVTVLHGEELEALGFETVWEALSLVPGLQATRDDSGLTSLLVRGIDFPFNSGNVKVLLNSVPLSRENAGINTAVLQIPMGQVERIEFVRGPGSVVYGDFAFMGLVNVVTRQKGQQVFVRYGEHDALSAGGHATLRAGGWVVDVDAAGLTTDEAVLPTPRTGREERAFGVLGVRRAGFSVLAQGVARELRYRTGPAAATDSISDQTHWAVEARYERDLSRALRLEARLGRKRNDFTRANQHFEGPETEIAADLHATWGRHTALFGASYDISDIDEAFANVAPRPGFPGGRADVAGASRRITSLTAQDRFELSDRVALTAGLRFDHNTDIGHRLTPRLSFVWRASERNILKLQYAEGFRAPTYFEYYGGGRANTDLDFEVNRTAELNFVHRRPKMVARATLFRSQLRDMVFPAFPAPGFSNARRANSHGVELEWEQQVGDHVKLVSNLSWVDEEDNREPGSFAMRPTVPAADWIGNVAVIGRMRRDTLLTARFNYVGERHVEDAAGWTVLDLSASRDRVLIGGLQLRGGVKNVLDSDVRHVVLRPASVERLPYPGRTFWVQLAWAR